jgi:asparagine synthase (glutamine-hydrolysing)
MLGVFKAPILSRQKGMTKVGPKRNLQACVQRDPGIKSIMCGFYGWIEADSLPSGGGHSTASREFVDQGRSALSRLRHRGPDHLGWYAEAGVFLGHARLAILDLNPTANQPYHEGDTVLLTNGEVYNFKELAKTMTGEFWRTTSDTEVVIRQLRQDGPEALPRFNGMFALAFYDIEKHDLLLARDRMGIKPLYYRFDGKVLEFASEIKAFSPKVDRAELRQTLAYGHFEAGVWPFEGICELPPGHWLHYVPGQKPKIEPWLKAQVEKPLEHPAARYPLAAVLKPEKLVELRHQGEDQWLPALETLLRKSVELHLRSDAPLGALCSGGLDSSLIAALAKDHRPDMRLYHCGSAEGGGEEAYARSVAEHLHLPLVVETMDKATYWQIFPWVTWHLDAPIYHPNDVSLYHIAQRAQNDGIKVLLAGEGADEEFGGYAWHHHFLRQSRAASRWQGLLGGKAQWWRNRAESLWRRFMGPAYQDAGSYATTAPYGTAYPGPAASEVLQGAGLISQRGRGFARWQTLRRAYAERGAFPNPNESPVRKLQKAIETREADVLAFLLEDMHGHLGTILHRTDRVLMGLSIEGRVPFLENDLIEFATHLPLAAKFGHGRKPEGKYLLKRVAEKWLPMDIVHRPKRGFPVAWQGYLPAGLPSLLRGGYVQDLLEWDTPTLEAAYNLNSTLAFRCIAMEVFGQIFALGRGPESIEVI